jgi:hypothetical protein
MGTGHTVCANSHTGGDRIYGQGAASHGTWILERHNLQFISQCTLAVTSDLKPTRRPCSIEQLDS